MVASARTTRWEWMARRRPLGIPTFEDKVLQKAVAMVLEAVCEQDFMSCSYGFRPGRSAHDAIEALWQATMAVRHPETGTPQGGVISPLLANIYLHEVLDVWWARDVKPRLRGKAELIRYADDFVMVFETEEDARRVADVLSKRFEKYGLRLHPEKTRLVRFTKPIDRDSPDGDIGSASFDLLGFTHFWAKSLKGKWVVKRKTAKDRFSRTLQRISEWCRANRHEPIKEQHRALTRKLRGHDAYFGITGNARALSTLRQ